MPQFYGKWNNKKEKSKIITNIMHTYRTNSERSYTSFMKCSN